MMIELIESRRARRVVERNIIYYRRTWLVLLSGFFEPLFYLLSIGVGIGKLVGDVQGPGGHLISYREFVAPALLASSAMNGAIYDSTMNIFYKLKHAGTYHAMLATPLDVADVATGEISWAMLRGLLYAVMFFVVALCLGLVHHPIAVVSIPAAVLIGFAFASLGASATCYARTWVDFEYTRVGVLVLFLFSATFYPLSTYPRGLQIVVEVSPLYQGVAMERGLFAGVIDAAWWWHALYLAVIGMICLRVVSRRLARLLKP